MQLLRLEVATKNGCQIRAIRHIKFLGCIMEPVRTSLAIWLRTRSGASADFDRSPIDWNPPTGDESLPVAFSDQLNEALQQASSENKTDSKSETNHDLLRSLHMRLLWEIHQTLLMPDDNSPESSRLMMPCMVGFPSLHKSNDYNSFLIRAVSGMHRENNGYAAVSIFDENELACTSSVFGHSAKLRHKIEIMEAPQQLHIMVQWNCLSKKATIQICSNEGQRVTNFC